MSDFIEEIGEFVTIRGEEILAIKRKRGELNIKIGKSAIFSRRGVQRGSLEDPRVIENSLNLCVTSL